MIHVGLLIKEVFDRQPKAHTVVWLAKQLNCNRSNIYNIFSRPTLDSELIMRLSKILNHDFFADLSKELQNQKLKGI